MYLTRSSVVALDDMVVGEKHFAMIYCGDMKPGMGTGTSTFNFFLLSLESDRFTMFLTRRSTRNVSQGTFFSSFFFNSMGFLCLASYFFLCTTISRLPLQFMIFLKFDCPFSFWSAVEE